ncbi:MAG: CPBP family intramembrane metalloprotease, partial [Thermoplasmata archaeon]|nr:CPBP family intramembrane metalloprotease [Thermoplasmata archaeon]NIS10468.1 CPBP family intramembrane metalloprotease [Thermoplasmata archaeon]NIS18434.1 CPBP family intramembrane metalloprotease [Thermoplasmata archaeon]NIT75422.1 CPBP family intramembrane metalloprotease [Thermoplasmata archaeon]NIU47590.1 CPBP family intramembrane metalloprotease [Thermoplasmata archaeon]
IALFYLEGPPLLRTIKASIRDVTLPPVRTDNALIMIPRMYLGIVGFYVVYFAILGAFTVEPEIPDFGAMPLWEQLHAFAEASVWEEILSRVLMLGVPLLLYHVWTRQEKGETWRYLVGGGFSIDSAAFVLIVFQALVFALAHVAGWDLWKVLPTLISGIAFGYLYLKKGLWASIILHFLFDYLGMTAPVMTQWGIPAEGAMNALFVFVTLVALVLMVHYIVIVLNEGPGELKEALAGTAPPSSAAEDGNP